MQRGPCITFGWANAFLGLAITATVGFAVWFTSSPWALLGLVFLGVIAPSCRCASYPKRCPKCSYQLVRKDDDDDADGED